MVAERSDRFEARITVLDLVDMLTGDEAIGRHGVRSVTTLEDAVRW